MGEEDVGAGEGEGEGEARGEEGLWVAAQEWRGMRSGDETERWTHGTRQERDEVARDFGCRSAPTRRRRVTAGEVNLGGAGVMAGAGRRGQELVQSKFRALAG